MPNKNSVVLGNVKNSLFSDFDSLISHRKDFGIFFTPDWVVDFIVELIPQELLLNSERTIYILEPACGLAQ
jgi:type I restriction-modification system DNA methylase subunit